MTDVTVGEMAALVGVGALAGVVSTVVSLASVISYPALLAFGLSPLSANVTNTVALVFTGLGAAAGSRPELAGQGRRVLRLGWITALGGAAGAALLLTTPPRAFEAVAPWLIAGASLLLARPPRPGGPRGRNGADGRHGPGMPAGADGRHGPGMPAGSGGDGAGSGDGGSGGGGAGSGDGGSGGGGAGSGDGGSGGGGAVERGWATRVALFAVAVYVGYFGAAGGILMFAVLSTVLHRPAAEVNAVKNVIAALANAVAALGFALFGPVRWAVAVPLAAGFLAGGWIGPAIARRLPGRSLRLVAAACGLAVAVKLGVETYRV
ncbi:sulfite exporter TauE/SafE family protein [Planomonospora sp. ID82291]|uniref:sulfite exporter TauE/SafE family protein n=1 Tax=Planomonospora sp. ID82291 TaxID=2738136 RepID=UPI0018C3C081|nr:sulfite exporter TauE/SafE family protein [Planomonospora sp. ID82291]MBG0817523.1 sulfite exporter TauE/SafE family protein [Planomonospora sp. ID82291]